MSLDDLAGDKFVHRYAPSPSGSDLTLLLLHGTGGDEHDLLELGRALSPKANLLSPRGRVLENGAPRFFRRLAEGVFDLPNLHQETDALATFILDAAAKHGLDPKRIVAVGFSNGANIAASILLSKTGVLAGAILLRPMVPFEPKIAPSLNGVPVLIAAGTHDPIVPAAQTQRLAELLRNGGAGVSVVTQPAGHGLTQGDIVAAQTWLKAF